MPYHDNHVHDGALNYSEFGDDRNPTIVCLHGLASNGYFSFGELVPYLLNNFHLVVLDMPGHGKTVAFQNEEDYLFSNLSVWLNTTLGSILQKPYYLLGHSWGADAALHFTRHFPLNVQGLMLLDGAFTFPQNQPDMSFDFAFTGWADYMDKSVFQSEKAIFSEYRSYTKNWDAAKERYARSIFIENGDHTYDLIVSKFTVLSIIKAFFHEPFVDAYPFIKIPTILIHAEHPKELEGARDKGIRQLKEAIEDTTVVSIPDSSHLLQWDHPAQLAAVIESWIAEKS